MPKDTIVIDVVDLLSPAENNFCDLFPFPLKNSAGFTLYFQPVPAAGAVVGMGIKPGIIQTHVGTVGIIKLIAFSSLDSLLKMFPQVDDHVIITDKDQGVPMQCGQMIVPVPDWVPMTARLQALRNADTLITYGEPGTVPPTHTGAVNTSPGDYAGPGTDYPGAAPVDNFVQNPGAWTAGDFLKLGISLYLLL